jgi:hypothetical protein
MASPPVCSASRPRRCNTCAMIAWGVPSTACLMPIAPVRDVTYVSGRSEKGAVTVTGRKHGVERAFAPDYVSAETLTSSKPDARTRRLRRSPGGRARWLSIMPSR